MEVNVRLCPAQELGLWTHVHSGLLAWSTLVSVNSQTLPAIQSPSCWAEQLSSPKIGCGRGLQVTAVSGNTVSKEAGEWVVRLSKGDTATTFTTGHVLYLTKTGRAMKSDVSHHNTFHISKITSTIFWFKIIIMLWIIRTYLLVVSFNTATICNLQWCLQINFTFFGS